jgi:FkbM family methyltransferase
MPVMKASALSLKFLRPLVRAGGWTYKVRQGVAAGMIRKGGLGFLPKRLSPEEKFLLELSWEGQTVYDVGGYEGVFTLFFSKSVGYFGRVFTFEPNPANCRKIRENILLNRLNNVRLIQLGLGAGKSTSKLVFWPDEPARGTINSDYQKSLQQQKKSDSIEIEIDSLDNQILANQLPPPDFIKIDVEAAELEVLAGMSQTLKIHRPRLFIEIHSGVDVKQLAQGLFEKGYRLHHVESNTPIDADNTQVAYNGHLYCLHHDHLQQG